MKVVYIASPYSGDSSATCANVKRQMVAAHTLMDLGCTPVAPLLSHYLEIYRARPYEEWLDHCLNIIGKCDAVVRLDGPSKGADLEVATAESKSIPVLYGVGELACWLKEEGEAMTWEPSSLNEACQSEKSE
jgi:hypothetical protein